MFHDKFRSLLRRIGGRDCSAVVGEVPYLVALAAAILAHLLHKDWAANPPLRVAKIVVIVDPATLSVPLANMALRRLDLTLDGLAVSVGAGAVRHDAGTNELLDN